MAEQIKTRMTAAEFFALPETNLPTELLNGELIQMPSPVTLHQRLLLRTARKLEAIIPNGEVFVAPLDVYFDELNIPQPDVMWVAEGSRCQILEKRLQGPPDLIVEILSPGTVTNDRKSKFRLYQQYGVREYWIIDPVESLIEIWQWVNGKFQLVDIYSRDETPDSPLLGRIPASDIFGEA
jgi:Uma2 family endonuclease